MSKFAQKLLTCYSSLDDVERRHTLTARKKTKYSKREMVATTEAYCEIASAESSKGRREQSSSEKVQNAMNAFQASTCMQAAINI